MDLFGLYRELNVQRISLYPVSVKTASGIIWGYINESGQYAISPQFADAKDFQENGLAVVRLKDRSGVINTSGHFVIPPKYESIESFSEGLAIIIDQGGFGVIDKQGKMLTPRRYGFISQYEEGRAVAADTRQEKYVYGYLDTHGNEIIPLQFASADVFHHGKAVVLRKEGEYALIDRNGNILHTYQDNFVGDLGDGLLAFKREENSKYGYMNEKGEVVIKPQFGGAGPFQEGRAIVNQASDYTNQFGLIDQKGSFLIAPKYNDIQFIGDQRAAVGIAKNEQQPYLGSKFALADTNGHFLTGFIYSDILNFQHGFASASTDKKTFFIDHGGQMVKELPIINGSGSLSFIGNLIRANVDQRVFYYTKAGRLIWQQNKVIPLNLDYHVMEGKYKPNKDYLVYFPQVEGMRDKAQQTKVNQKLKDLSGVKPVDPNVQLDYSYTGDFEISLFQKQLLVIEMYGYNFPFGAAHGMPSQIYAHVDLQTGAFYMLKDLFKPGSDYVKLLSDIIGEQIKTDDQYSYVFPDSYKGVKPDQPFYVTNTALFIYFEPYEIAPYVAGFPKFKIPYSQILHEIAVNGAFWQSFH